MSQFYTALSFCIPVYIYVFDCTMQLMGCFFPDARIEPRASAARVQSPNHWTTREFPTLLLQSPYLFLVEVGGVRFSLCLILAEFFSKCSWFATIVIALKKKELFVWLHWVLAVACGIQFPDQGMNSGPLHQEHSLNHWTTREVSVIAF